MMEERCKKIRGASKYDKVVSREVCQITSKGTRTLTYQDECIGNNHNFLLTICQKTTSEEKEYGICFIDTSIGKFTFGQFKDDRHGSRLLTLIASHPPVEVVYDKNSLCKHTLQLLNNSLTGVSKEGAVFRHSQKVLRHLQMCNHFKVEINENEDTVKYPEALENMLDKNDRFWMTPLKQYELALVAFGGCIQYLEDCRIDDCLLTMKLFEEYVPVDAFDVLKTKSEKFKKHMVLDGVTLQNLEIVPLHPSGNVEGTLLGTMDYCSTSFGKRLFRSWLCSPLCNPDDICSRLNAIDDLSQVTEIGDIVAQLKKLPDLERLLSKIHTYGLARSSTHPDSRAIYYDAEIYNKRKIADFISALQGFKLTTDIMQPLASYRPNFKSSLLKRITSSTDGTGIFPDMEEVLDYFNTAFDHESAKKHGSIIPSRGVDTNYDSASNDVNSTLSKLEKVLENTKKSLSCKVTYVGSAKTRYQLEIPDSKTVPKNFEFVGGRKGFKRYYTAETKELLSVLTTAEERRSSALRDVTRNIFERFDANYKMWKSAVDCISTLDALISLLLYYESNDVTMCKPEFSLPSDTTEPFLKIIDGRHPTFLKYFTGGDYIPNNVYIGPKKETEDESINAGGKMVLVTGPNMGGKSTLMRQAGTLALMAHLGSYVPAESMQLTPVDRIFTRVGASDQISKGESTFFVEASETSSILHYATKHSLVLIDELGRGTATYDGTAIAYAAGLFLSNDIECRTLFSTHYHSLVEEFSEHPNIGLGHMACMVEKDDDCPALEKITFLYKFINGACPKSYGFNVALLAGIMSNIVHHGFLKAQQLEYSTKISKTLKSLLSVKSPGEIIEEVMQRNSL